LTVGLVTAGLAVATASGLSAQGMSVTGRISLLEQGGRASGEVGQAVVWLTGATAGPAVPATSEMATEGKQFVPRLRVVARGSTVSFPNHDPFNHNVFSLSPESPFDLGSFGRGAGESVRFDRPGIIRIFCNVHAQMRGIVVVLESGHATQPGADGSFTLAGVPPGEYLLHVWHERAAEVTQSLRVSAQQAAPVQVTLDARGYRLVQHRDKNGKSYGDRSRRY
jgi:plastocyanin